MVVVLVLSYIMIIKWWKPEKSKEMSKEYINSRLAELGQMGNKEKIAAVVLTVAMICWILQSKIGIAAYIV